MSPTYKILNHDADFMAAALSSCRVSVWFCLSSDPVGHLIDYGGVVEAFDSENIKINGAYFVRERFEFRAEAIK